jgi:hypothetical protein
VAGGRSPRTLVAMDVSFHRAVDAKDRRPWVARVRKMRVEGSILGSGVGDELPHDLVTFVVERELGLTDGFFGTVAAGGTFRSMAKRRHRAGKAVIARNRSSLDGAEHVVHEHWDAWRQGRDTPCTAAFERAHAEWRASRRARPSRCRGTWRCRGRPSSAGVASRTHRAWTAAARLAT